MARATAGRKTGDGRVHRTGRQGKVRAEHPATGAYGPGEATRTPPVADQMDSRHMSATVSGRTVRRLCIETTGNRQPKGHFHHSGRLPTFRDFSLPLQRTRIAVVPLSSYPRFTVTSILYSP